MPAGETDILWPHFVPLWRAIGETHEPVLIGGYGLKLKQRWLRDNHHPIATESGEILGSEDGSELVTEDSIPTLISASDWPEARATEDMDFVLRTEIVLTSAINKSFRSSLDAQQWQHAASLGGRNWQLQKQVGTQILKVEFHMPDPPDGMEHTATKLTWKPKESLGDAGIHARKNPESFATPDHATVFSLDVGENTPVLADIRVAHPVNMAVMKLHAMADRLEKARTAKPDERDFHTEQAGKHAGDIALSIAMTTLDERNNAPHVLDALRRSPVFDKSREINHRDFLSVEGWGRRSIASSWSASNLDLIHGTLSEWFA